MGTHTGSEPAARGGRGVAARARHQTLAFTVLGALCCLAALVFTRWNPQEDPGRWYWSIVGTLASVGCLLRAQRAHGGTAVDRDASTYYGMFAGVTSGALLLTALSVHGSALPGVFFVMAVVLAVMAWIEQSAIGMTAAVCVAVLSAGSGVAGLGDATAVGYGSLAVGVMLLSAALALGFVEDPAS